METQKDQLFIQDNDLSDLLADRLRLTNKRCKSKEEELRLKEVKQSLKKINRKYAKKLVEFPYNVPVSMLTMFSNNISVYNYNLNKNNLTIFVNKFDNVFEEIGKITTILYNNVIVRQDNMIDKIYIPVKMTDRIVRMKTEDMCKFMKNEISVKEFYDLIKVV